MYILWPEQLAYIEMDGVKRVKCWPLGSWTADLAPSTQIIERNALLPKDARERELPILVKKNLTLKMPEHEIFAAKASSTQSNKMRNRDSILSRAEATP